MRRAKIGLLLALMPLAVAFAQIPAVSSFAQIYLEFDESLYPFIRPAVQEIIGANWRFPPGLRIRVGEPICPQQETVGIYCSGHNLNVIIIKPDGQDFMLEVLRHELGHATADVMGIAVSACGEADYRRQFVNPECSWSEGWADFFAASWARSPYIRMADINLDTYTPRDTERPWVSDVTWTLWTLNKLYSWEPLRCALNAYPRPTTLDQFLENLSNQCGLSPVAPPPPPPVLDSDGDGIPDNQDQCPLQPGPPPTGCPPPQPPPPPTPPRAGYRIEGVQVIIPQPMWLEIQVTLFNDGPFIEGFLELFCEGTLVASSRLEALPNSRITLFYRVNACASGEIIVYDVDRRATDRRQFGGALPPSPSALTISPSNGSTTRRSARVNATITNPSGTTKMVTAINATGCTVRSVRPRLPLTLAAGESRSVRVSLRCPRGGAAWTLSVVAVDLPGIAPRAAGLMGALVYYSRGLKVNGFVQVQLFDLAGRQLAITKCGEGTEVDLPNGVYLYVLRDCNTGRIDKGKLAIVK